MGLEVATVEPTSEDPKDRRARLEAARSAMAAAHDRALLTLSAGAFSGSILFYEKIAPHLQARGWLVAAWLFFGACSAGGSDRGSLANNRDCRIYCGRTRTRPPRF